MSRRDNAMHRCATCAMHQSLCICSEMPRLHTQTRLCLVMHHSEARKTTNTGRLALNCLPNSECLIHGRTGEELAAPWEQSTASTEPAALLLYPCDEAEPLAAHHLHTGPVRLVVPDGNWRQAAKMTRRIEWMAKLPRVSLPEGEHTSYRLRFEPKAGGLATMEAIARAYGVLEGPAVQVALETIFHKMVDRTLFSRGLLPRDEVAGGIPEHVQRHRPDLC